jgi:hypothetical protein
MLTAKASMFHLLCIFLLETCSKNAEVAENGDIFQFMSIFQRSVTHFRVALEHTKPLQSRPEPVVCVCALSAFKLALFWR